MTQESTTGMAVGLIVGLLMLAGCGSDSSQTGATGQVLLEVATADFTAEAASGQCATPHMSATLDIVGVRTGIPMTVNPDCSVTATVPDVPVGTWTFRIIYRSAAGGVPMVIAEASGIATVTANTTTTVPLALTKISGPATAIATGTSYSCALLADGAAFCWGANSQGQLGNGTTDNSFTPVAVGLSTPASAVATSATFAPGSHFEGFTSGAHSCALLTDQTVKCWGNNSSGQLGPNAPRSPVCSTEEGDVLPCSPTPVAVGLSRVVAIATGEAHSCVLLADQTVKCWGANNSGQLGRDTSAGTTPGSIPAPVTGLTNVDTIAAGDAHSCVRLTDQTVKCWGHNSSNQLGNATPTPRFTPVPVTGLSNVAAVAAGGKHSCARLADGTVWCWGANESRQLGNGSPTRFITPVPVTGLSNVAAVATGGVHGCAVLKDGAVRCWGANFIGQLGNGTTVDSSTPVQVVTPNGNPLTGVTGIAAGGAYSCAFKGDGSPSGPVWCWGSNLSGELGNGETGDFSTTAVQVVTRNGNPLTGVTGIAAGFNHSCALKGDGSPSGPVWCWGSNLSGELGNGETGDFSTTAVQVVTPNGNPLTGVTDVTTGMIHSCARMNDENGTVACWGDNFRGQLGRDTSSETRPLMPRPVAGLSYANGIAAGGGHSCAILRDGNRTVWCWGANDDGQLGNGRTQGSLTPVEVFNLAGVSVIAANVSGSDSNGHTCATLSTGTARCWGDNSSGQLGNGSLDNSSIPEVVTGLTNVVDVAAGFSHGCARLTNGTVSCWGNNRSGQLGNGVTLSSLQPVKVVGIP
jgi:alpha-tubulin suppressor-like RCC1 family protein